MKERRFPILPSLPMMLAVLWFTACQTEEGYFQTLHPGDPIEFGGFVRGTSEVRTRLDSSYITADPFVNMDFFIQLCCQKPGESEVYTELGVYEVPSGFEGRLEDKKTDDIPALNWHDLTSPHVFYSWNMPWEDSKKPSDENGYEIEPVEITFESSVGQEGFNVNGNNKKYENFVGAKSAAHSYVEHGKYVDLTFYHLVSKIIVKNIVMVKTDGSMQEHLEANLTFNGMPTAATFYPHPEDGKRRPYVGEPITRNDNDGVTYYIDNNALTEDVFYICPEVDFSKIDYQIKITNEAYKYYDTYYGTFSDVNFKREPGTDYDQGGDEKILHAGEVMTINITLIPGVGPGLSVIISDWSTDKPTEAQYHTNQGLYSDTEFSQLLNVFLGQTYDDLKEDEIERLFNLYGETNEKGEKVFKLYDDLTAPAYGGRNPSNIFPVWEGYIIDGMGHTVTLNTNTGVFGSTPYYNVGAVRDIYLADPNGNNPIYIDSEGFVWVVSKETGEFVKTSNFLPPLKDPYGRNNYKGYDINSETGEVRLTTYYNNSMSS